MLGGLRLLLGLRYLPRWYLSGNCDLADTDPNAHTRYAAADSQPNAKRTCDRQPGTDQHTSADNRNARANDDASANCDRAAAANIDCHAGSRGECGCAERLGGLDDAHGR